MNVTTSLKVLGWFTKEQIYAMANGIYGAVYAFAFLDKLPEKYQHPNEFEDTFYIGVTGGRYSHDSIFFDRKDKNTNRGEIKTLFKSRMKTHFRNLDKRLYQHDEDKYELFHNFYEPQFNRDRKIFVYVAVPQDYIKNTQRRALLSLAESEYIYSYGQRFDKMPLMNLDEQDQCERIHNSVSEKRMRNFEVNTLEKFVS